MKLSELDEICAKATPGPWHIFDFFEEYGPNKGRWEGAWIISAPKRPVKYYDVADPFRICSNFDHEEGGVSSTQEDAQFIATARTTMPSLLKIASAAASLLSEEGVREKLSGYVTLQILDDALEELTR